MDVTYFKVSANDVNLNRSWGDTKVRTSHVNSLDKTRTL